MLIWKSQNKKYIFVYFELKSEAEQDRIRIRNPLCSKKMEWKIKKNTKIWEKKCGGLFKMRLQKENIQLKAKAVVIHFGKATSNKNYWNGSMKFPLKVVII